MMRSASSVDVGVETLRKLGGVENEYFTGGASGANRSRDAGSCGVDVGSLGYNDFSTRSTADSCSVFTSVSELLEGTDIDVLGCIVARKI